MWKSACGFFKVSTHKCLELQASVTRNRIAFSFDVSWYWGCDHAGGCISLELLVFYFHIALYDTRHAEDVS